MKSKSIQSFRDEAKDLDARIIQEMQRIGPRNVAELSRLTGAHPETVRYKVKKQFRKLGFRIHAEVAYRKLGLVLYWAELRLSPRFGGNPRSLFVEMNKSCYLVYYAKLLPQGNFVGLFAIPSGRGPDHNKLLSHMHDKEILQSFLFNEVTAARHPAMNPRFFNFQSGKWEVDWNAVRLSEAADLRASKERPVKVDYQDLLILKELQLDAQQHIISIAKKVRVHQKTLEYHYREHLQKKNLVSGFIVRWQHDLERSVSHTTLMTRLTFRNLGSDLRSVQSTVTRIPFLWAEDLQANETYLATIHIPIQEMTSTLDYLNRFIPDLYGRVELSFVKRSEASAFTIPHHMFKNGWTYDLERMKRAVASQKKEKRDGLDVAAAADLVKRGH